MTLAQLTETPEDFETCLTTPTPVAMELQRPLPDGGLKIVARGLRQDGA